MDGVEEYKAQCLRELERFTVALEINSREELALKRNISKVKEALKKDPSLKEKFCKALKKREREALAILMALLENLVQFLIPNFTPGMVAAAAVLIASIGMDVFCGK